MASRLLGGYIGLRMAGGGLWSSAADLLRFGRAMLGGGELDGARVLAPAFVDLMTREVTVDGLGATPDRLTDEHYAIGWGKPGAASPASPSAFGHGGMSGTRLWIDPAHDLVFVYLTGVWGLPTAPIDDGPERGVRGGPLRHPAAGFRAGRPAVGPCLGWLTGAASTLDAPRRGPPAQRLPGFVTHAPRRGSNRSGTARLNHRVAQPPKRSAPAGDVRPSPP